jgi:2'-hydroxyisoflavone reductase
MRILILGGTTYLGPYQIKYALERGHEVTIFNRGKTVPTLFTEVFDHVEKLKGDREDDLESLKGREWDAVIDNSATNPKWVHDTAQLLKGAARYYLYTSSTAVYYPYVTDDIDETTELVIVDYPESDGWGVYGVAKARSEMEAQAAFPDGAIIIRPHYIIGPGDPNDRLTRWVVRVDVGGEVLAPGDPDDPVQLIDVRDLTEWMIRTLEQGTTGAFTATGPQSRLSSAAFMSGLRAITSSAVSFTWTGTDFLVENGLQYMVPWVAPRGDFIGVNSVSTKRAVEAGLTYRPLAVTARENLEWWYEQSEERRGRMPAMPTETEARVLAAWNEAAASG